MESLPEKTPSSRHLDGTSKLLADTLEAVIEGAAGIAGSNRRDFALSVGTLFKRTRSIGLLGAVSKEWNAYREKGQIKEDYSRTPQHQECLAELLEAIDNDNLDNARFSALKAIFLVTATETVSNREESLPQHYMRIVRRLSGGAITVLGTEFHMASQREKPHSNVPTNDWVNEIAENSGLRHSTLVRLFEHELIENGLISQIQNIGTRVALHPGGRGRLTELGYAICQFLGAYDEQQGKID
jgi:hypothetical protein